MKPYCKHCVFYLKFVSGLSTDGDEHVCGESLRTYIDELGIERYMTYGDTRVCTECGRVEHDGREVRFQKCIKRNKGFKCSAFKPKWYLRPVFFIHGLFSSPSKKGGH